MNDERIYLLENFKNTPWLVLEDTSRVLLNEYTPASEYFRSPKIQDFKNYIKLLDNLDVPYMMYNNTFECQQMSKLIYDTDIVNLLNSKGLHIFLTENLLKYNNLRVTHDQINKSNILEFNNDTGVCSGIFENPRTGQLDSIQDLINNNHLTNVIVHVGEHNVADALPKYSNIKFVWKDLYLQDFINRHANLPITKKKNIKYTFININWRYEPYRHAIVAYLKNYNSKISWCYQATPEIFKSNIWFEPNEKLLNGLQKLNKSVPCNIDISIKTPTVLEGGIVDRFKLPNHNTYPEFLNIGYDDVFCSIVNESSFLDITTYISDKTITAILNDMPFVIVGPAYALKTAQDLGFKTFNKYWDESYDNELDHTKRLHKIFKVIDTIANFSADKLASMQQDMQDSLLYNKQHIKRLKL
tara:strand:+ start:1081 stop:2322 length:1242 start_codon:yes stop_codon:yes gene_type:complete